MQSGDISLFEIQIQLGLLYFIWQAPALEGSSFPGTWALYGSGALSVLWPPCLSSTSAPGPP